MHNRLGTTPPQSTRENNKRKLRKRAIHHALKKKHRIKLSLHFVKSLNGRERTTCGNFSDTSRLKYPATKGSIGHTFMVCIHTENQNQGNFYPFVLHEISVLVEFPLGNLRYLLTDVPPHQTPHLTMSSTQVTARSGLTLEGGLDDQPCFIE